MHGFSILQIPIDEIDAIEEIDAIFYGCSGTKQLMENKSIKQSMQL